MKAAVIEALGGLPGVRDVDDPEGATIRVLAAPLNPIDLATSRGVLAAGHPELPYVPGCEAVGTTAEGRLVWIFGGGLGTVRNGAMAERAAIGGAHTVEVPAGADPALAAALGIAGLAGWLPFAWRAPLRGGEDVLVPRCDRHGRARRGAVGEAPWRRPDRRCGTQSGRARARAVRRSRRDRATRRVRRPRGGVPRGVRGGRPGYVFDPLWGAPAAAAVEAAVPGATIVNLGQSAGATSELASAAVRFKSLNLLGHTNFALAADELAEHYGRLVGHALAGEIRLDVEQVSLDDAADAWRRQADGGAGAKLVLVPG